MRTPASGALRGLRHAGGKDSACVVGSQASRGARALAAQSGRHTLVDGSRLHAQSGAGHNTINRTIWP
ncbi:hypothetical protein XcodCFBP4690_12805 [Xanthomonas codiaei]|uniref:Uncharacterized protein n=2 Tax=Xanthomonas codiaei TaxID=56463 RepID=A0A2S7CNU1_9XANT|nr:hypothetical protein XcodCFBP4690_12805 [Xanthomonas codiaei]